MKKCKNCQETRPISEFSLKDKGKPGTLCRVCAAEKNREWYNKNKGEIQVKRSVNKLSHSLNLLRRKAQDAGYKIDVKFTDQFVITMEKI